MSLQDYFENTDGIGILATADSNGFVNTAVYSRPHFINEKNCIFLMSDKRSHRNILENPHSSYIFIEQSEHYEGKRLYLTKTKELEDAAFAKKLRRKKHGNTAHEKGEYKKTFAVYFRVDSVRALVGD